MAILKKSSSIMALVVILSLFMAGPLMAADARSLEQRIQELERQLSDLKRQYEADRAEPDQKASKRSAKVTTGKKDAGKETPAAVTASAKDGFTIKAADDSYKLKISGYVQADARIFAEKDKASGTKDSFLLRTVRPVFSGSLGSLAEFYVSPEFAGSSSSLPDAYVDLKFFPGLTLRGGKFKAPFALERARSVPVLTFGELALPANLAPNRDLGFYLYGDLLKETLSYAAGIFNGVQDGASSVTDSNSDKDFGARIFVTPFKNSGNTNLTGLGFGGAVTFGDREDATAALAAYKTMGQLSFFSYASGVSGNGNQTRFSPQLYYYNSSFGLLSEYILSKAEMQKGAVREEFENSGWQASASYVLTGEEATYKGVAPKTPFSIKDNKWGAFEIAVRYSTLDVDDDLFTLGFADLAASASRADAFAVGLNWYLTKNIRYLMNFEKTEFDGGAAAGDRADEDLLLGRIQFQY